MNNDTTDSRTKEDNTYKVCRCHGVNSFFFCNLEKRWSDICIRYVNSVQIFNSLCVHTYLAYSLTSDETKHVFCNGVERRSVELS